MTYRPDTPEACDKCPRDYYTTVAYAGRRTHLCLMHYRRIVQNP